MKKGQRKWLAGAVVLAVAFGGAQLLRPVGEQIVGPIVQEQLNTAINGQADYSSFNIGWDGTVHIGDLSIKDTEGKVVADVPSTEVSLDMLEAVKLPFGQSAPLRLIKSVTLNNPTVHAVEKADRSWNITSLIKKSDSEEPLQFRGNVIINDGIASLDWLNGRHTAVEAINGAVKFADYPKLDGALSANVDKQAVTLKGSYTNDDSADFTLFVKADSLRLDYVNDLIPSDINAKVIGGTAKNIALTVSRNDNQFDFEGAVDINNLAADYQNDSISPKPYEIRQGAAHVTFNGTDIMVADGRVAINDQQFFAHGNVDITDLAEPNFNLTLRGQDIQIESLIDKGITGSIGTVAHVYGTATAPIVNATVEASNVNYEGYILEKGLATLAYQNDIVDISDIRLSLNGGEAGGRGTFNTKTQEYEASLEGTDIPLALVGQAVDQPLFGTVNGKAYVKGIGTDSLPAITATFEGNGIGYDSIATDSLSGQIAGANGNYFINYLNGTIGSGSFSAYGNVSQDALDIAFDAKDVPLNLFSDYAKQELDGKATVTGRVTGPMDNPNVMAIVASDGGHVGRIRFDNAYAEATVSNKLVTVNNGFIQDGHGYYSLNGTIDMGPSKALQLQANANTVRIENIAGMVDPDLQVTGWLDVRTDIGGTLDNPQIRGFVHAWDGSVQGKLYSDVRFGFRYANDFLGVRDLVAQAYGATFYAAGRYQNGGLDFKFFGDTIYLRPWLKDYADVEGYMTLEGTLTGTIDKPIVQGRLGSNDVVVNDMALKNISGNVYADPTVVHLQNVSFEEGEHGKFNIDGGMTLNGEQRLFGYATISNGELVNFMKLAKLDVPESDGHINGRLDLGGTLKNPDLRLIGTIDDIVMGGKPWGTANVDVALQNRKLTIHKGELLIGDGMLAALGTADLDGQSDIQIAANNVAIDSLMPLFKTSVPASGNIHLIANVTGETLNPHVELSTELTNASLNGVQIDRLYAMATMEDKVIHLQQLVGQRGEYKAKLRGDVPLAAFYKSGYLPPGDKSAMDLTFDVNEADLGVLPLLFPAVTEGTGPLKGALHITGTYDQPMVNGTLSVDHGLVHFKDVKKDLSDISAQLIFKGQKAELIGGASMGKGNAGLSGEFSWNGTTLTNYAGVIQMNDLEVEHEFFKGPLNGEVGVMLKDGLPTVVGHLDLENDTMTIPLSLTSEEGGSPIGLDFTVNVGKKVRLYSGGLYDFTLGGGAHIGGTTTDPFIDGEFHVVEGNLKYLNNTFKITEGKTDFIRGSFLPILSVKAESRVRSYRVYLEVNGPVEQMDLKLTSDPHLEQRQIVSLLTFGYSSGNDSSVSSDDVNALFAAGVRSALMGYIEGAFKDTLGLDLINITTGSLDPNEPVNEDTNSYYNIEIGKYLLPDLMVTFSTGINNDTQAYGIMYDINSHYNVNGWMNSNGHSYFGGQWTTQF
ncbi:translocation/assembly module TamB domain-containing protein [Veillonella sp.]|uniref:translocation/assembly module TamB domain-containing protein n=1 Tax=Veillonella sp. TaxID=1926307 RepID=UPI0025EBACC4|nr:translocation/assembly module TamB domain-containing protein [Veillonella sp.]